MYGFMGVVGAGGGREVKNEVKVRALKTLGLREGEN